MSYGVLPDDDRTQSPGHERGDHIRQRTGCADVTFVRLDPDEMLFDAEMVGIDLTTALEGVALAIFRVDVDRPNQTVLPQRTFRAHGAGQTQNAYRNDLQAQTSGSLLAGFVAMQ